MGRRSHGLLVVGVTAIVLVGTAGCPDEDAVIPQLTLGPTITAPPCADPGTLVKISLRIPSDQKCQTAEILFPGTGAKVAAPIESRTEVQGGTELVISGIIPPGATSGIIHTFCDGKEKDGVTIRIPCASPEAGPDGSACSVPPALQSMLELFLATASACSFMQTLALTLFDHSSTTIGPKPVANDHTTQVGFGARKVTLDAAAAAKVAAAMPCGDGPNGRTLCPPGAGEIKAGGYVVAANRVAKPIPLSNPKYFYQVGFVFDRNGIAADNYTSSAQYKDDLYKGADRFNEALYAPATGWTMKVSDASGTAITPVTGSTSRILVKDDFVLFLGSQDELSAMELGVRSTWFRHPGTFGLDPPYDYDGSVFPAVDQPLFRTP